MEQRKALGEAIRMMRNQRNLPQEGIGASQSYISSVERGEKSPSIEKIEKISMALDVHPMSLLAVGFLLEDEGLSIEKLLERVCREVKTALSAR